jgi:hypothetical protein
MRLWKFCSAHHKVGVERDSFKLKNANASEDGGCVLAVLGVNRGRGCAQKRGEEGLLGAALVCWLRVQISGTVRCGPMSFSRLLCCLYRQQRYPETAFQGLFAISRGRFSPIHAQTAAARCHPDSGLLEQLAVFPVHATRLARSLRLQSRALAETQPSRSRVLLVTSGLQRGLGRRCPCTLGRPNRKRSADRALVRDARAARALGCAMSRRRQMA